MTRKPPDLQMIMERVGDGPGPSSFKMWACRGEGKGCKRNVYRARKVHCDDCIEAHNEETLAELQERIRRGEA